MIIKKLFLPLVLASTTGINALANQLTNQPTNQIEDIPRKNSKINSENKTPTDGPARAIWIAENKLKLTLPENMSPEDLSSYYLWNDSAKIKIPLFLNGTSDRNVALTVKSFSQGELQELITGSLSLVTATATGEIADKTSIQLAGLLDSRFYYSENDLGVTVSTNSGNFDLKLWAPTAINVQLYLYRDNEDKAPTAIIDMTKDSLGIWKTSLNPSFNKYFYLYKVNVYSPTTKAVESNFVTDPYSKSLSINSQKSQIIDINNSEFMPIGWRKFSSLPVDRKVIYEAHLRDLTANDPGLSPEDRGTFWGLTKETSRARQHLKSLVESGLTYIHFLPLNDFATVNEDKLTWERTDLEQTFPPASDRPQAHLNRIRHDDAYNWGYDPFHYFVPEGSYAKNANGYARIKELRTMIQSLDQIGLKTIVDVVFNHTYSSGNDSFSVLNKIVPLYYYRLNEFGNVYNSSCCSDTASEHKMMEKLMIDAVVYWAKTFKVSGFRFDLMSFHTRSNMLKIKEALNKLTLAKDGVNGSELYLYGEGWGFGSLFEKNPSAAFTQLNSFGAGIGFFNDRFRDAIRGGTTDSAEKSDQGFATGLYSDFNKEIANKNTPIDLNEQKNKLLLLGDVIKVGLAGNLRDFAFKGHNGDHIVAKDLLFRGAPTGYAATPVETVNYVSAHDGYCLWDAVSAKAPFYTSDRTPETASTEDKQRMQQFSLGLTLFSQGVPFIEGGSEILRSKSGDVDSYDSGDWFNHLNWDYKDNNWGKGLPPSFRNSADWSFWAPRLNEVSMKPSEVDIRANLKVFKAYLKIRNSSALFNLKSLDEVNHSLKFIDNESAAIPGLIALSLTNNTPSNSANNFLFDVLKKQSDQKNDSKIDSKIESKEEMLILFNANRNSISFKHPLLLKEWKLHPFLGPAIDPALKNAQVFGDEVIVPGRTIVVLLPKRLL